MNYIKMLPGDISYVTLYRLFVTALGEAQLPWATIEVLDHARHLTARRRDMLVGRQRRHYSPSRENEIEVLASIYDDLLRRLLAKGWR